MLAWLEDVNRILEEEGTPQFEALAKARYGDLAPSPAEVTTDDSGS